jgi:hypothetical protein
VTSRTPAAAIDPIRSPASRDSSLRCFLAMRPGVGPPPSAARSGPASRVRPGPRWSLGRSLSVARALPHPAPSLNAASGRRSRRRGWHRDASLSLSPGPEAFPAGPSKSRGCAAAVEALSRGSALHRFRERRPGRSFPEATGGPPRGPAGSAAGPGVDSTSPLLHFASLFSRRGRTASRLRFRS